MKIQSICKIVGEYGCFAFNYLWCVDIPQINIIRDFSTLKEEGILNDECKVLNAKELINFYGIKVIVEKSDTAPTDDSKYIGIYVKGDYKHAVGMQNGKIVNNTLDYSHCVSEGKLATKEPYRIIKRS